MRGEIGRRKHALGRDVGDGREPAVGDLLGHRGKALLSLRRKARRRVADDQLGDALGMREGKGQRQRAAEAVADEDGVVGRS